MLDERSLKLMKLADKILKLKQEKAIKLQQDIQNPEETLLEEVSEVEDHEIPELVQYDRLYGAERRMQIIRQQ